MKKKRVIIVGAGFAGLTLGKELADSTYEVLILDRSNHHLFQPLLYQVATGALSPSDIAMPIRDILCDYDNISVLMSEVVNVNKELRQVEVVNGTTFSYDYLIIATGSRHSYFGKPDWEKYAPGLKSLNDAVYLRNRILYSFEQAEQSNDLASIQQFLTFVIVGGGPTGVELAGAIGEIAHKTMLDHFRKIDLSKVKIYVVEANPYILNAFPQTLSLKARKQLESLGVQVLTESRVNDISDEGVTIGSQFIATKNVIWAAGNEASPLLKKLDIPLDGQGRAIVNPDLSIPGSSDIFVLGDAAHYKDKEKAALPGIAPVAIQQAQYMAKVLLKEGHKQKYSSFSYHDKGSMATIGKARAIAWVKNKWELSGFIAWLAWSLIHVFYLIGFRNRFLVMLKWSWYYVSHNRSNCLITYTQAFHNKDNTHTP
ncbi:MAG: ndh [Chlamydiales bacterium]|jgi:NADH dehydrogenase|nr:ndh [Chlamydiales bacterium]